MPDTVLFDLFGVIAHQRSSFLPAVAGGDGRHLSHHVLGDLLGAA
jgi:hypothetical protein